MRELFDDIKGQYRFYPPCPELAGHIEYFWESCQENDTGPQAAGGFSVTLFPSWSPTMSINLGTPYEIITPAGACRISRNDHLLHCRSTVARFSYDRGSHKFGVKFYPGGLQAFLPRSLAAGELSHQLLSLDQVVPPALIRQVKAERSFEERADLLQDFFLSHLKKQSPALADQFRLIRRVIEAHTQPGHNISAGEAAQLAFATPKTVCRHFQRLVGVPPKVYFNAARARNALAAYVSDRRQFAPFLYGYYDRSHFYRDVRRFTGQRLGEQLF